MEKTEMKRGWNGDGTEMVRYGEKLEKRWGMDGAWTGNGREKDEVMMGKIREMDGESTENGLKKVV
jgi:hypothetical protein